MPDLDLINRLKVPAPDARPRGGIATGDPTPVEAANNSMPTALDYTLTSGLAAQPLLAYGLIDFVPVQHMRWRHPSDGTMVRTLSSPHVGYGLDLFVAADAQPYRGFQRVARHQWQRYGSPLFAKPRPQAMPFDEYFKVIYPAILGWNNNQGFAEFDMDGQKVGGWHLAVHFWFNVLSNSPWWNNPRDAVGMYLWGQRTKDEKLLERARRIVNLAMLAPRTNGLFACEYHVDRKEWKPGIVFAGEGAAPSWGLDPSNVRPRSYHTAGCSITGVHLLRYDRLCEKDDRIAAFLRPYADLLLQHIDQRGQIPMFFNADGKPNDVLPDHSENGANIWFFCELYAATRDPRYLSAAEKAAGFLIGEVIPRQRWRDFEGFFSCGFKPVTWEDTTQNQDTRGQMPMLWASAGLGELFRLTGNRRYLDAGEQVIDYVSLYQTVWDPHFVYTAYAYGGFDTDNGDAAWLNCHTAWTVGTLALYGKELGRQDLLEPGDRVVTMQSLLEEMTERDAIARKPSPSYVCRQVSSWDRTQALGTPSWWNNRDYNQFLREEQVSGRTEYVLLEDAGPGCITRIWKPLDFGNETPKMTIRFYLDGSSAPALQGDFSEMVSGRGIFEEPFAFIASDEKDSVDRMGRPQGTQIGLPEGYRQLGGDLYFPIPYSKGCKVTIETHTTSTTPPGYNVFYYHINYRSYEPGAFVESFTQSCYDTLKECRKKAADSLLKPGADILKGGETRQAGIIKPAHSLSVNLPQGPGAIREFVVALDPTIDPAALRSLFVEMAFDGEQTVWCPVSEFFGGGFFDKDAHPAKPTPNGVFIRPHWNRDRQVEASGVFSCYFVMPYQSQASVQLRNAGKTEVQAAMTVRSGSWAWDDRSMLFHANWRLGNPARPICDWNYIEIEGDGVYVADTLSIHNPGTGWYGEGDERITIDGETFPSQLGTGTEDYYGYAWGMANFWNSSFISAPDRDARGKADWSGNHTVSRERLLDAIPFRTSLKVDMEAAENGNVPTTYAAGTFWYARPGARHNREMPPREAAGPVRENAGDPEPAAFPVAVRSDRAGMHIDNGLVAVDGVEVRSFHREGRQICLELKNQLAALPVPYDRTYAVELRLVGLPDEGDFQLVLNGGPPVTRPAAAFAALPVLVQPDGRFATP